MSVEDRSLVRGVGGGLGVDIILPWKVSNLDALKHFFQSLIYL